MSKRVGVRSSRSLRGERNEERGGGHNSRGSNLNSAYSSYRIQVLITKEWNEVVPGTENGI